jgi:hypothetical protein
MENPEHKTITAKELQEGWAFRLPKQRSFRTLNSKDILSDTDRVAKEMKGMLLLHFSDNTHACRQMKLHPDTEVVTFAFYF